MSTQIQRRRGTKAENEAFTGALGEFVYETDSKRIVGHDGARQGGFPAAHFQDIQNQKFNYVSAGGTAAAITATTDVDPDALVVGMRITLKMTLAATGAATLAWGSLAATNIKLLAAGVKSDPGADEWAIGDYVDFIYDGIDWIALLAGGGGGGLVDYQVFTSSGTWTKPAGVNKVKVTCVGGGAGGAVQQNGGVNGGTGGTTTFGAHASAGGGSGGINGYQGSGGDGGQGGTATVGDILIRGGDGGSGGQGDAAQHGKGGDGGASSLGGGGAGMPPSDGYTTSSTAFAGDAYGSGGGGGTGESLSSPGVVGAGGGGAGSTAIAFVDTGLGASETVTVGGAGSGANRNGQRGGNGAAGVVIVEGYK